MRILRWIVAVVVALAGHAIWHGETITRRKGEQPRNRPESNLVEDQSELLDHKQNLGARRSRTHADMDRIREAAKWGTGLFTAIGALLIASVGLDGIGSFDSFRSLRFAMAVFGTTLALLAILFVMLSLLPIFTPQDWTLAELLNEGKLRRMKKSVENWYESNPRFLTFIDSQGSKTFETLQDLETAWQRKFGAARDDPKTHYASYEAFDVSYRMTLLQARYVGLREDFRWKMKIHVPTAIFVMIVGISALTWASNPPTTDRDADTPVSTTTQPDVSG